MQPSPIIERLAKLPRGQRFLLYIVLYVVVGLLYVFTIYYPSIAELDSLRTNKENLKTQKAQVEARVANKETFDQELERLTKELSVALTELPSDREIPGLLKGISQLGRKVGLDVRRDILLNLQRSFNDDRYAPHPLLEEMVAKGHLGQKSGQGFFEWN